MGPAFIRGLFIIKKVRLGLQSNKRIILEIPKTKLKIVVVELSVQQLLYSGIT
jgi:hypothetical protein